MLCIEGLKFSRTKIAFLLELSFGMTFRINQRHTLAKKMSNFEAQRIFLICVGAMYMFAFSSLYFQVQGKFII